MSTVNPTTGVNGRDVRGAQIAASCDLRKRGDEWIVPSQSGSGTYRVRILEAVRSRGKAADPR
jgi:hypothetical protein